MDIRQLKYFIAIAEEGSLSAASARLHVAQPSLSQHVIKIERELGVTLVDRSPRGILLTESGSLLLEHAREICASMERCRDSVSRSGLVARGPVSFGMPPSVSMVLSVPLAETVRVELPDVQLRAVEAMSGFINMWLDDHTVDLGFLYDTTDVRRCDVRQLLSEYLHFFSAPDNWPASAPPGTPLKLSEIAELELILPSAHHGLRKTLERYARMTGIEFNVVIEMDALSQIKELVARGSGYTILAPAATYDRVEHGELVASPIIEPELTRPVYLVRNQDKPMTKAVSEVERITIEVVDDLISRRIWHATGDL